MLSRSSRFLSFSLACAFFLLASLTSAQVRTAGTVSGTVVDPSGAVVPGASLTISEASTGFSQTVTSNSSGEYVFPALQPGTYSLAASATGFASTVYSDVVVSAARTSNIIVQMKVGAASQTVEVSAQGQVLETTSNTLSTTVGSSAIQNLPLNGRDILGFALLVPGAQNASQQRFTTINGLPNAAINITVDGMNDNFQRFRTSTTGFFVAAPLRLGAMDEVTVSTNDLTAEAGSEGSTQIRFVTKRGTNQFHGSGFWEVRNDFFNANSFTNNALGFPRSRLHLNDFGGNFGGPFWKTKLFFFVNYEELDQPSSFLDTTHALTTAAQQGNFSYVGTDAQTHIVNLLTLAQSNGFPSTVDSTVGGIFTQVNGFAQKGSQSALPGNILFENQLSWSQTGNNTNRYPTARLDYQITPKVAWHGSWDLWWRDIKGTPNYPTDPNLSGGFRSTYYTATNAVDWTVSSHLLDQFNFGILGTAEEFNPGNSLTAFQSQGNRIIGTPFIAPVVPGFTFPVPRNNPVWQLSNNLIYTRGNHTFTFGGDTRWSVQHQTTYSNPASFNLGLVNGDPALGMFNSTNFPAISTANNNRDLANAENLYALLVGRLSSISGTNNVNSNTHQFAPLAPRDVREGQTVGGIYMQDAWRVTPHLALNYGFRWQFSGAVHNTNGLFTSPTIADLLGPSTQVFQPGVLTGITDPQIYLRPAPFKGDFLQPAPNFGFAWNPDFKHGFLARLAGGNNLVVRGGASISHYDEGWVTFENAAGGNPGDFQSVSLSATAGQFAPGSLSLGSSNIPAPSLFPAAFSFPIPESLFTFTRGFSTVDPAIRSPYVESWYFGVQRKLPWNTVLQIDYVGNHSVHMWQSFSLNETNIFENGFLNEFKNAQTDLAINQANGNGNTFADNTGAPGLVPLPIFDAAFGGSGSAGSALSPSQGFQNSTFVTLLQQGQAGALANSLAGQSTYLCRLVGNGGGAFSPCSTFSAGNFPINFFQANPFSAGNPIRLLSDPASATYDGLQVQIKHPVGRGLMLMANYTYSHSLTDRYIGNFNTSDSALLDYTTLRNKRLNKGPSPYDLRHVFRTYLTYDLPFGPGRQHVFSNSILNQVVGGWTASSILTLQSGRVFELLGGNESFNQNDAGVILNGIGVSQLQGNVGIFPGPTPNEPVLFLNPKLLNSNGSANASFVSSVTTPGQLGNFVFLYGPKFVNTDIALLKAIPITERISLNVWAEFLNAFNHPAWNVGGNGNGNAFANIQSSTFAGASLANGPRNIQFRMQLAF